MGHFSISLPAIGTIARFKVLTTITWKRTIIIQSFKDAFIFIEDKNARIGKH
jgi:hypothetical protein